MKTKLCKYCNTFRRKKIFAVSALTNFLLNKTWSEKNEHEKSKVIYVFTRIQTTRYQHQR